MTTTLPDTVLGRPLTTKEKAENAAYKTAHAALTAELGRTPTTADDAYWRLPGFTSGANDPELVNEYAREAALAKSERWEAPDASEPASAPVAPGTPPKAPAAKPDANGVIFVPGKVCRDCSGQIERKPGAGRPPVRCLACRAKHDAALAAEKTRKAATR